MKQWMYQMVLGVMLIGTGGCATQAAGPEAPVSETRATASVSPTLVPAKKPAWLTPEKEAALVEVRKILREASQLAQSVVIKDPESKEGGFLDRNKKFVLRDIVAAQARAGDIDGAIANGWEKSEAVGLAYARAGQPHEALKVVNARHLRPEYLEVILEALHKSGDGRTALDAIENVYIPWDRAETLFLYARFLTKIGDPAANAIAQRAYTLSNTLAKGQPWVYARLGEFQADAGDLTAGRQSFQKARDAALAVSDPEQQLNSLLMVAKTQLRNMDQSASEKTYAEAIRVAKSFPLMQQEGKLGRIAREQLKTGQQPAAAETVRLILQVPSGPSLGEQAEGLMRQARWHLTLGDQEAAKAAIQAVAPKVRALADGYLTAKLEKDDSYHHSPELGKSIIYSSLAQLAADCGLYDLAQEAVRAITTDQTKANAIRHIITGLTSESERPEVQQVMQTLVEDATSLTGIFSFPRDLTLLDVAVIQAAAGDMKTAVRTADRVVEALRAHCYGQMVGIFHKKGEWTWAHEVMSKMKRDWVVDESSHQRFQALTRAEARAGFSKQAREWASMQQIGFARAYALLGVAEGLMDRTGIEQLFPAVRP